MCPVSQRVHTDTELWEGVSLRKREVESKAGEKACRGRGGDTYGRPARQTELWLDRLTSGSVLALRPDGKDWYDARVTRALPHLRGYNRPCIHPLGVEQQVLAAWGGWGKQDPGLVDRVANRPC